MKSIWHPTPLQIPTNISLSSKEITWIKLNSLENLLVSCGGMSTTWEHVLVGSAGCR